MALVSHFYLNYGSCCSFLCFCSFYLINWLFRMVQPFFISALLGFSLSRKIGVDAQRAYKAPKRTPFRMPLRALIHGGCKKAGELCSGAVR